MKVGIGYDIHRLVPNRKLVLGGVAIAFEKGPDSHSDGDVLLHAVTDALLGACGAGDIGQHFPNTDARWKNVESRVFVQRAMDFVREAQCKVGNLDATIFADAPKLAPHLSAMKRNLAEFLQVDESQVNLKAGTNEGCDAIGHGDAIAAQVIVLLV
ncbi:MAG: 2-C-methyl-D-erythritol 2,4-cyclodiphosphate synthase [Deltaproteobacteria bacterium]|nr:2-C-methyl-D-erythritol 2,4-cyclodiphosphate synthase [Deltaproteobacteria bacterium]